MRRKRALETYLTDNGFSKVRGKDALRLEFAAGFSAEFAPEDDWDEGEVYFYVFSERFGSIMDRLFAAKPSLAGSYLPRKLVNDSEGCLGMVLLPFERGGGDLGDTSVTVLGEPLTLRNVVDELHSLDTIEAVYDSFYKGKLGRLVVVIEGMWVYLYFAQLLGLSAAATLETLQTRPFVAVRNTWRLRRDLDEDLVNHFSRAFEASR